MVSALTQFARSEQLEAAQITAVGAFEHATVGEQPDLIGAALREFFLS